MHFFMLHLLCHLLSEVKAKPVQFHGLPAQAVIDFVFVILWNLQKTMWSFSKKG